MSQVVIRSLLARDPDREIESVVKITDHDPRRAWVQMDEYVPTDTVRNHLRQALDILLETRRGAGEGVCIWVSGFFGSGKSHFLKVLGYLLEDRRLVDSDGSHHSSQEFLARKLGLDTYLPHLQREFRTKVLYLNLLDHDPQDPQRPTISRLIYRHLLESQGLCEVFWVARWERDLQDQRKWEEFRAWVEQTYGRPWERQRMLHAEATLRRALPFLFPELYSSEAEAERAIAESKERYDRAEPGEVVDALVDEAKRLDPQGGRLVVLLDEVGLYIGDQVDRLTDLNRLAEQIVERGQNRVLLVASAQEAITDLVPRLTKDRQVLEWLQDRFVRMQLLPTDVEEVIAQRLLQKTPDGAERVRELYRGYGGSLRENLSLQTGWTEDQFLAQYPCPPYAIRLLQDVMASMRGSVEEMRRLSGSERSMLKLVHAILRGEGGICRGAEQPLGWLVSLDLFWDALKADLVAVRSDQVRALEEIERNNPSDARVAKALFLLQQVHHRYPCTPSNLTSALAGDASADVRERLQRVEQALARLREAGWVAEQDGQFRLLTPAEHALEVEVHSNWPDPAERQERAVRLLREVLGGFRYEHGQIRRHLEVALGINEDAPPEQASLRVWLFTPLSGKQVVDIRNLSIAQPQVLFWIAEPSEEFVRALERAVAVERTLKQRRTRAPSEGEQRYRQDLEREYQDAFQVRLPHLITQAFLRGWILIGGREERPSGSSLEEVLRQHLRSLAEQTYTGFIDCRVRDEDVTRILEWTPGGNLPSVYDQLGLVGADGQIRRDAGPLSVVRAEIERRHRQGEDRSGRALLEALERPPYGWDPRLVRLLVATLFKMGVLRIRLQGQEITDPSTPLARSVFAQAREFARAIFEPLPEVDWRQAGELCSQVFGVSGGETFERVAETVLRQAREWRQRATTVSVRARDNGLPRDLVTACEQAVRLLEELAQIGDPNGRLRTFLEHAQTLNGWLASTRALEGFPFDEYRRAREFVRAASEWARDLTGEARERWERFSGGLQAPDLLERWSHIRGDYAALVDRYRQDYAARHREFQQMLREAIKALRQHKAFAHAPDEAGQVLSLSEEWVCTASGKPESEWVCASCRRSYSDLHPSRVAYERNQLERQLDGLLPQPSSQVSPLPLQLERAVSTEAEVDALAGELRQYLRRVGRRIRVQLTAQPESEHGSGGA
jgi:hypothetical protein